MKYIQPKTIFMDLASEPMMQQVTSVSSNVIEGYQPGAFDPSQAG